MYKNVRRQDRVGNVLILPVSISQSICCRLVCLQKHREHDMDSGSMSTLPTLSCLLTFLYNPCLLLKIHGIFFKRIKTGSVNTSSKLPCVVYVLV